ncbi:hypothetical protein Pmar_PMAR007672 [Perkinsus marinus ATCC 50983]|uniref:Uncharacterized protein n=1 Tax=Perkinsus marinus (strain ATCC 50983 / TXsc) TaxID=423536 RepID=C5LMT7_PERM5|nr:hypothetical protein Pmar_PMAR007672 [Perkinsus marinus ATCC 50983]EER01978.1 hypothetical protein Pmar_PMAR007672 [Perkinsus marinus ATCC 50983]|eukprot:XP_002769260.1 hypothetical protein Pmar_PMAR007672 [Perkinsus marinus ATCC 50983]
MKSFAVVATLLGLALASSDDYCQQLCDETPSCASYGWGSYCKGNGVCFGLLQKGDGYCFQPADSSCDDSVYTPVSCPVVPPSCEDVCNGLSSCKNSKWGSYCKSWQSPPVCFGILEKDDGSLCFQSTDSDCVGKPYPCPSL